MTIETKTTSLPKGFPLNRQPTSPRHHPPASPRIAAQNGKVYSPRFVTAIKASNMFIEVQKTIFDLQGLVSYQMLKVVRDKAQNEIEFRILLHYSGKDSTVPIIYSKDEEKACELDFRKISQLITIWKNNPVNMAQADRETYKTNIGLFLDYKNKVKQLKSTNPSEYQIEIRKLLDEWKKFKVLIPSYYQSKHRKWHERIEKEVKQMIHPGKKKGNESS